MDYNHLNSLLLTLISISFGGFLGALGNNLIQQKSNWVWGFYLTGVISIVISISLSFLFWEEMNRVDLALALLSVSAGGFLIIYSKKHLTAKNVFTTEELHPRINRVTQTADKSSIKLFGGDLDFFGKYPSDMDSNSQYVTLKNAGFRNIEILCEEPNTLQSKIRYGKLLSDLRNVKLKFYHPERADLKVRGRILQISGVSKLVMFEKIQPKKYKAIQTDRGNSTGELYHNLWDLVWSLAIDTNERQILEFKKIFSENSA